MVCKTNVNGTSKKGVAPLVFTIKQSENAIGFRNRQYDCGFRPSVVMIKPTKKNDSSTSLDKSYGRIDSFVFPPLSGTSVYTFGDGPTLGATGISDGQSTKGEPSIGEINDTGFTLTVLNESYNWDARYVVEFEVIAYP